MPPQDITPDTPTYLVGLRASKSDQYFWIGYTADDPYAYFVKCMERAKAREGSPLLLAAISDVLASGDTVAFDNFTPYTFPRRDAQEKKMQAIAHFVAQGHPLRNSEVERIERKLAQQKQCGEVEERQRKRLQLRERKAREKELYHWPAAPEGCRNIYAEEEWIEGGTEPRVVRVGDTKNSAGDCNRGIGFSTMAHPYTEQAKRVRSQKERGVRRRLRLLEVHPRAGLKAQKDAWAQRLGL